MMGPRQASSDASLSLHTRGACRRNRRGACALAAAVSLFGACMAFASEPAGDAVRISTAQAKVIGVRVLALTTPAAVAGPSYPARVVLPRAQEQIISATVGGSIDQVLVEDHANVEAGQPLLRLNSPQFGEWQLKLLEATNQARVAASTLAREKALFAEGIIPERRVIEAQASASNARAAVQHARAAIGLAGADEATIAKIAAGSLQDRLVLRAPRAATVLAIAVKPGQRVAEADPLLTLGELGRLWLDIDLPANRAAAWDPQGRLQIVGRDATARPLSAAVQVGEGQTVNLRAEVVTGADRLRPGEALQVQVPLRHAGDAWRVPNAAIVHHAERTVVFVATPDGFRATDVAVVGESPEGASISGELKSGDAIAVAGTIALKAAWLGAAGAEEE